MDIENKKDMSELNHKGDEIVQNVQEDLMSQESESGDDSEMDDDRISELQQQGDEIVEGVNNELADKDVNAA